MTRAAPGPRGQPSGSGSAWCGRQEAARDVRAARAVAAGPVRGRGGLAWVALHPQSAHIAQGVDVAGNKDESAGDQGITFDFACDETSDLIPATIDYSYKILPEMASDRHSGAARFPEPDAKSQVTLHFENGKAVAATAIVVSTEHGPAYDQGDKEAELHDYVKVVARVLPAGILTDEILYHTNPTGAFEIGGPDGLRLDDGKGEDDPLNLVVGIKGGRDEDDKAEMMRTLWVPGVSALGTQGRWAFAEFTDVWTISSEFGAKVEAWLDGVGKDQKA